MFQLGDKQPNRRIRALCAAALATLLCSCAQRTATSPQTTAEAPTDADMPEVVITAARENPLRLAAEADAKSAPGAK
jgi:hypothetical protein